jgi:hypothetical protein
MNKALEGAAGLRCGVLLVGDGSHERKAQAALG